MAANWQSFSIGAGHTVNFVQPSSSAVALNRVLGSDVSVIQGALNANGQVFLINPNGVLFTPTAQVNVGGIVASTLNLSNEDFLAGRYRFSGDSTASVINQGNIQTAPGGTAASSPPRSKTPVPSPRRGAMPSWARARPSRSIWAGRRRFRSKKGRSIP
jgi:filamentous hemagglutinin family protein